MSNSVDSRIVEMRFDNSQFESAARRSLGTLERLKNALANTSFKGQLADINHEANSVDLSGVQNSLTTVSNRFSTLGIMATRVLQNISDLAWRAGMRITSSLLRPLDMIKSGGMARAMNLEQAQFQFKGLGMSSEKTLDAINKSLQGTPYSLDQAAKVMSSLGASGITDPKRIEHITASIAGAAAMTNSTFADIGDIYTTVASNGHLMTEQIRQFSARGMNISAVLGKQMGKSEAEIQDMVSKGKISFKEFSDAMEKAFGKHATESTQMYTGALEDLRAALARIGAKPAKQYLLSMRDIYNGLVPVADRLNAYLDPIFKKFNGGMKNVSDSVVAFLNELGGKGNPFTALDAMFTKLISRFPKLGGALSYLWSIFKGLFSAVDIARQAFVSFIKSAGPLGHIFKRIGMGILGFLANIGDAITEFDIFVKKTKFFDDIGKSMHSVLQYLAKGFDFLADKLKGVGGSISDADISGKMSKMYEGFKKFKPIQTLIESVGNTIIAIIDKIGEVLGSILENVNFGSLTAALATSMVWQGFRGRNNLLTVITEFLAETNDTIGDFKETVKEGFVGALDELKNSLLAYQGQLKANMLIKIAGAIFILAVSLNMLAGAANKNGKDGLAAAVAAIGAIMFGLTLALKQLMSISDKVEKTGEKKGGFGGLIKSLFLGNMAQETMKLTSIAASMVAIAAAVGILSFAVAKLAKLHPAKMLQGLAGVMALVAGLVYLSKQAEGTKRQAKSFASFSKAMITLSIGLNLMAFAIGKLAKMKLSGMAQGIGGILALIGGLVGFSRLLDESFKNRQAFASFSGSIIALSVGLNLMAFAVSRLAKMKLEAMAQGIGGILSLVGALVFLSKRLGDTFKERKAFSDFSKSIVVMSVGLTLIANSISKLAGLKLEAMVQGIGGVLVLIGALVGLSRLLSDSMKQAEAFSEFSKSIVVLSVGLTLISNAIVKVGSLDFAGLAKGIGGLALAIGAIYLLATQVSNMTDIDKLGSFARSMIVLGIALNLLAGAISKVGNLGLGTVTIGILGVVSALLLFSKVTQVIGKAIGPITKGSLAITAMSVAIGALGIALTVLAEGINAMKPIFQGLWDLIKKVAQALFELLETIANSDILQSITAWLAPDLSKDPQFAANYRRLGEQAGTNYTEGVKSKSGNAKEAAKKLGENSKPKTSLYTPGANAGQTYVSGIKSQNTSSKKAGKNLGENSKPGKISMFNIGSSNAGTYVSGVNSNKGKSKKSGEGLAKEAKKGTGSAKKDVYDTGSHTGAGFAKGLNAQKGAVASAAKALANAVPTKLRKLLIVRSPSRVTMAIGDYVTQGFIKGIGLRLNQVKAASEKMATIATTGPNKLTDILANSLSNIEDYQPTIKPVVDLTNVNASASAMNAIFGKDVSISGTLDNVKSVGSISRSDIAAQEAAVESIAEKMAKKMSDAFAAKVGDTNHTFNFNIPFDINGREVAKSIATYTQDELNKMESRSNRQLGIV